MFLFTSSEVSADKHLFLHCLKFVRVQFLLSTSVEWGLQCIASPSVEWGLQIPGQDACLFLYNK
jgi:hypothetical protein